MAPDTSPAGATPTMSDTAGAPGRGEVGIRLRLTNRLGNEPELVRRLSGPLLRIRPNLTVGGRARVTRHEDVREVLERDEDFTVAEVMGASIVRVNGPFILGMDRSPLYLKERDILECAVHPGDPQRIGDVVRTVAADLIDAARPAGRLDVVQGFARPAAARLVADYFGVPGPDEATMLRWMRDLSYETFCNATGDPVVQRAGEAAGDALRRHLDDLIAARRSQLATGGAVPDDFLTRLVLMQDDPETRLSDEGVRRNLGGVIVAAVETTSKAVANAAEQLLRRPAVLAGARAAALAGDVDTVGRYAFEALRFNPIRPVLVRHAARDAVLAAGTRREHRIRAGCTVYAAVLPAMFDPGALRRPSEFRTDRPASAYLHFGAGLHRCFGRYLNLVQIPELLAALLRLGDLSAADGDGPTIGYDGPFPDRFPVTFSSEVGAA
jgi:cytochrome P450